MQLLGTFKWQALNPARGGAACLLVVVILLLAGLFAESGVIAAVAALKALLGTVGWQGWARLQMLAAFTLSGALLVLLSVLLAMVAGIWGTVPLVLLVVAAGGLLNGAGKREANAGLLLNVAILAIIPLATGNPIWQPVLGFLIGGGIVLLLFLLRLWRAPSNSANEEPDTPPEQPLSHILASVKQHLSWQSVVLRFALVRAAAVTIAYTVGIAYFAAHPFWAAVATLLIIRPAFDQTFVYAIERSLGTLLGAAVGIFLLENVSGQVLQIGLSLLIVFVLGTVMSVNYALFITFLTLAMVWIAGLSGNDPFVFSQHRVLETMIGMTLGMITLVLMERLMPPTSAASDTSEQADPATLPPA